jgi:DUF1680 family protein
MALTRRSFIALAALGVSVPWRGRAAILSPPPKARPAVPLSRVRLLPGPFAEAATVNRTALLAVDPDRLLHMFRITAGIASTAAPLGGWEAPDNELRGHSTGHHLSALAACVSGADDEEARVRALRLVAGLRQCQTAHGNGYLSAFPETLFDRLRAGQSAWAPFYTLHKLLAGLLDVHESLQNADALAMSRSLALWIERWTQPLGVDAMARVLEREYGGLNEALYRLARLTGEERFATLAARFDHERIFVPLAADRDELTGLHVNTTLPKLVGALEGFDVTGDRHLGAAARHGYRMVSEDRCYVTGGTSNGESWNSPPGSLAGELSGYTQECCVSYNLIKLAGRLHAHDGATQRMDDIERLLCNGILGVQHPVDGQKLYYVPLAGGYWKLYGTPLADFWCCTGSMAEAHAQFGSWVYSESVDCLGVELWVASRLTAGASGLSLRQETRFPETADTRLIVEAAPERAVTLELRIPAWARSAGWRLNGVLQEATATPGSRLAIRRHWSVGDTVELHADWGLDAVELPGDPGQVAVRLGPLVLAARLGREGLDSAHLRAGPTAPRTVPEYPLPAVAVPVAPAALRTPSAWLTPTAGSPLTFHSRGAPALEFVPLYRIVDERFAVYLPTAAS